MTNIAMFNTAELSFRADSNIFLSIITLPIIKELTTIKKNNAMNSSIKRGQESVSGTVGESLFS